jgi:hypothetical protein
LPKELLSKVEASQALTEDEKRLYESHPEVAGRLLAAIPRLEDVAAIVTVQFGALSFAGKSDDVRQWDIRSIGQLLLRTSLEFDRSITRGTSRETVTDALSKSALALPAPVLKALLTLPTVNREFITREVFLKDLSVGMLLDEDLVSPKGIRLVPSGQEVTRTLLVRLTSIAEGVGVAEPFRVRVPT